MDFVFCDKENTQEPLRLTAKDSQNPVLSTNTRRIQAKTFQSNVNTVNPTPRKALGDVNFTRNIGQSNAKSKRPVGSMDFTPAPTKKQNKRLDLPSELLLTLLTKNISSKSHKQEKTGLQLEEESNQKQEATKRNDEFDKEYMPPPPDQTDDYSDIWSKSERPESWMSSMANWHPASSFYFFEQHPETNMIENAKEAVFTPAFENSPPELSVSSSGHYGDVESPPPMPALDDLNLYGF